MKLFSAESDIYLLRINSLETTVTGVLESMLTLLQKPGTNTILQQVFEEGQVFQRRANMDSMK